MKPFAYTIFTLLLALPYFSFAQINDCAGAEVICSSEDLAFNPQGPGLNDFADPDNFEGCMTALEQNSAWYYFEIDELAPPGLILGFTISPNGGLGEDYDWALYGPDVDCEDLGFPIRCSSASAACDLCPETGMGMGAMDFTEGPGVGDGFVATLQVEPGQGFFLLIDNWLGTTNGFELSWEGTAAEYLDCEAEPPCGLNALAGDDIVACENDGPFSLNGGSSGNEGNENYTWTGTNGGTAFLDNPNTENPTVTLPNGFNGTIIYTLSVTENDCAGEDDVEVTVNPAPAVSLNPVGPFCENDPPITLTSSPPGGIWGGPVTGNSFDPMESGSGIHNITYTYTDGNNCTAVASIDIEVYTNPEVVINPDPPSFCLDEGFVLLTATGSSGNPGYSYEWTAPDGSGIGDTYNATVGGDYTVEVTDANGCTNTFTTTVTINPNPIVQIVDPGPICENVASISLDGAPSGGVFSGTIISPEGDIYPVTVPPGTYTVSYDYLDVNNCAGSDELEITIFSTPNAFPSNNGPLCEGQLILLFGETDGVGANVSYLWTGPNNYSSNQQNPTDATEGGAYLLQVLIDGCASEFEATNVVLTEMPDAVALNDGPYCAGQSIQLLGSTNTFGNIISYDWTGPNFYVSNVQNPTDATADGVYFLTVTVDGCPSEIASTEVIFNQAPDAQADNNGPYCEGDIIELIGNTTTPGSVISYTWNGPNNYESFVQNPIDALDPGLYELVVNVDGCISNTETTTVLVNALPQPEITGNNTFCIGNSTTIDAGGGYTSYIWDDTSIDQTLEVFSAGTYSVTVTDANNCTGEASFEVTESASLSPEITGILDFCEGENTTLDAGGGYTIYEWSNGESTQTVEIFNSENISVVVTDQDGCSGSDNVNVTEFNNPVPVIGGSTTYCVGGNTILDAGGGYTSYIWSNDSTSQSITVATPGDYSVDVIDQNGCEGTAFVTVEESTSLNPVISGDFAFCENGNTILDAGAGFDTYLWSDNSSGQTLDVDAPGDYSLTVSDSQGCSGETTVTIEEVAPPLAVLQTDTSLCNTEAGGSFLNLYDLVQSGDMNGNWEDTDNSGAVGLFNNLNFNNILAGDYTFTYTTNSAIAPCPEASYQVTVTVIDCACPDVLFFDADPLCNGGETLELNTIENTAESGIWTIIQTPAGTNPATLNGNDFDATGADSGEYILQFDLQNQPPPGCPLDFQVSVTVDQEVSSGTAAQPDAYCFEENQTTTLIDLINGGDANGVWTETSAIPSQGAAFNAANGTFQTNGQQVGNYTFEYTVVSSGACPDASTEVSVVINELPMAMVADLVVLNCTNPVQSLDAGGSSFGLIYDIAWTGPGVLIDGNENTLNPNIDQPGIYELTVTNTLTGCTAQASTDVNSDTNPPDASAGNDNAITCNDPIVTLQASGDIGTGFEILWSGPAINVGNMNEVAPQVDLPGLYILSITDLSNSCVSVPDTIEVLDETTDPDIFIQFPTSEIDCNNASLSLTGGSVDPNVSFQWLDSEMMVFSNNEIADNVTEAGTYTLIVTNDLTGCTAAETVDVTNNADFPTVNIGSPSLLDCINEITTLDGTGSDSGSNINYQWSGPAGGIAGAADEITANAILPGVYTLLVTNTTNGCTSTAAIAVEQDIDIPAVEILSPEELNCATSEVTLDGTGSSTGTAFSYIWTDASGTLLSNSISHEATTPGVYELTVLNTENGCSDVLSATVIENTDMPSSALLGVEDPDCFGDQNALIFVDQVVGGTSPYLYSLNQQAFSSNNFFNNLSAGDYELTLEDANGCLWDTLIHIQQPAEIDINLGPDIDLELGDSAEVRALVSMPLNEIDTLIWTPDDLVNCADSFCLEGIVHTFNTVLLSATVIDENGCEDTDQLRIVMQKDRRVFIPSAFSPNADGTNDIFFIFGDASQIITINKFQVFNRWGALVHEATDFQPNDPDAGWKGDFKGESMNPGVFVYYAEVVFIDGVVKLYKGDVTLMK